MEDTLPKAKVLSSGYVYRNPKPHLWSRQAAFPSLVALENGDILCAFDRGSAIASLDRRTYISRSSDGGETWSEPGLIFEPDESRHPVSTSCRISRLPGGDLIGLACLFDRTRTDEGHANSKTGGFVRTEMATVRSTDHGITWSRPEPICPAIAWERFEICSPIVAVNSKRLLAPTSIWPDWGGACPHGAHRAIAFVSSDAGRTWPSVTSVLDMAPDPVTGWEQKQAILADGRLMAICWTMNLQTRQSLHNHYVFSSDAGDTFGPAIKSPVHGETNTPLALRDNHILAAYRRVDRRGLWVQLARIDGDAWKPLIDVPIWGTEALSYASDEGSVMQRMHTLQFGCPTLVELPGGDILLAFWCVEDCTSNIRWYRLGIDL